MQNRVTGALTRNASGDRPFFSDLGLPGEKACIINFAVCISSGQRAEQARKVDYDAPEERFLPLRMVMTEDFLITARGEPLLRDGSSLRERLEPLFAARAPSVPTAVD